MAPNSGLCRWRRKFDLCQSRRKIVPCRWRRKIVLHRCFTFCFHFLHCNFSYFLYETYLHWKGNCWVQGLGSRLSEQNLRVGGNLSCECRKLLTTRVILSQNAKHDLLTFTRQSSTMHHLLRVKICWWRQMGWENGDLPLFDEARCRGQCWNCHRPRDAWSQDTQTLKGFSIGS